MLKRTLLSIAILSAPVTASAETWSLLVGKPASWGDDGRPGRSGIFLFDDQSTCRESVKSLPQEHYGICVPGAMYRNVFGYPITEAQCHAEDYCSKYQLSKTSNK